MKERPISFKAEMVRAILAKEYPKTQTRREMSEQPTSPPSLFTRTVGSNTYAAWGDPQETCRCPYGRVGDRLWVKEPLFPHFDCRYVMREADTSIAYRDGATVKWPWKPKKLGGMYCPRWASRLTLEVTRIRVERLTDISEPDALAECCTSTPCKSCDEGGIELVGSYKGQPCADCSGRGWFPCSHNYRLLWESINGKGSWAANPWVWVIEFKSVQA